MISNSQGANFKGLNPAGNDAMTIAPLLRWLIPIRK